MSHFTSVAEVNAFIGEMKKNRTLNNRDILNFRWRTPLDNHYPTPRAYANGFAIRYTNDHYDKAYILWHDEQFGVYKKLAFLMDGEPFYLASWNVTGRFYILQPITNTMNENFGPRKMYSVTLTKETWV